MAKKKFILAGLLAIGMLFATGLTDNAWARRDVRQDECPSNVRCAPGEVTPDADRTHSDDDTGQDDIDSDDNFDTAPD